MLFTIRFFSVFLFIIILMVWLEYFLLRDYNFHEYMYQDLYSNPFLNSKNMRDDDDVFKSRIIISGLARNIGTKIKKNIENCVLIGSFFKEYKIIIFENDSEDDTRDIIKNMTINNPNIILIDCPLNDECKFNECNLYEYGLMNNNRIDRMAFFRNIYLHLVYKHFPDYDYLFVIDFDIDGVIPISGIYHALNLKEDWSCICANGRSSIPGTFGCMDTMYDAMAYCKSKTDIHQARSSSRSSLLRLVYKYIHLLYISQKNNEQRYISVFSAFNGFCIYRLSDIYNLYYKYGYNCEHISLHEQLIKNGKKIWIDLDLCIYVGHQGPTKISQFLS